MQRAVMAIAVSLVLALASASVPYGVESLEDLYRIQRLYQLSQLQNDPYLPLLPIDDIDGRSDEAMDGGQPLWGEEEMDDSLYNSPLFTGAQARDEEHLQHSALQGLHAIAGGTLEGESGQKQVKTDKPLPAYCNPPNPCPVGKTAAADNCVENFENSMENNKHLLEHQDCPCDTEHMWSCPAGQQTVTSKGSGGQAALSKVMSELAELNNAESLSLSDEQAEWNPYFEGKQLTVAAKKGGSAMNAPLPGQ